IICWGASDWFGALGAFAWLPWAWWGLEKALGMRSDMAPASSSWTTDHRRAADATTKLDHRDSDATHSRWHFLLPAPFVSLVGTGGFPYPIVLLIVLRPAATTQSLAQSASFTGIITMLHR